jgi:hypothetical protein
MPDSLHSAGPGRAELARRAVALQAEIAAGRRNGTTLFLSGDESDGRELLLRALAAEFGRTDALVVAGRLGRERFESWAVEDESQPAALKLLQSVVGLAEPLLPVLALFSLVITQSRKARQIAARLQDQGARVDPGLLLPQLLQRAASERPVVLVLDCAAESGWWEELLTLLARESAAAAPILLVVGIEPAGPDDDEPRGQYTARTLVRRGLARSWPLERVGRSELAAWIGRAEPPVVDALLERSGGRAGLAVRLWQAWQGAGVVERADESWRLLPGAKTDIVAERVAGSLELLTVAALESRHFTAEAVAHALGRSRDEVVDELDDELVEAGLIEEVGLITIHEPDGTRHLWQYRFVSDLDRLSLRATAAGYSERLAEGLVATFGAASELVAPTLARLFDAGGNTELAGIFWAQTRLGDDDVALWRAARLLGGPAPASGLERQVATEAFLAAAQLRFDGPFEDGLAYSRAALRDARDGSGEQGLAHYYSGWFRINLGELAEARRELTAARAVASALQLPERIADVTYQLAGVDYREGDYVLAKQRLDEVLEIRLRLGDDAGVAYVRERLAQVAGQGAT